MGKRVAHLIATGFGLGYLPKAPGSWGSLGAVALMGIIGPFTHPAFQSLIAIILFLAGIWASNEYIQSLDNKDPSEVVIDEIAGQWIALVFFAPTITNLLLGFFLFRLFDIWKPLPVRLGEKLPGGLGIMMDDILAGIAAHLCLKLINQFLLS
ncbi:phosphatidylglycerophosphatase A [Thermodesulfatator indicus DSM 15286]|uniref:Phosphatidylglycerophosphatase A n=1 Tax=Thermodesulfatator indicus (strain DSM 15286 / JCM 11887 / CIR29812) TaxID=667014 RepID=F8AD58_THEID|nr:phosphatidylglycerophosphatase A [Thermodesulfatator indicus]AEH44790.1 phosphatidylglycerophosphatase A [Thermodesulfatator indicus DSM 15286]